MVNSHILDSYKIYVNLLKTWRFNKREYKYLRTLFKNSKRKQILNKTIVFNTVKSQRHFIDRELYLGKILALNGAKVIILLDDGVLKHWEGSIKINYKDFNNPITYFFFKNTIKNAIKTYKDKNLRVLNYSKILSNIEYNNWQDLKKHAKSSTTRHFQNSELDYNEKIVKEYYHLSIINSVLSKNIGKYVLEKIKPDFFITSHGIYSTWGPAYEFLKEHGIESYVFVESQSHSTDHRCAYFTNAKAQTLSRCKFWQQDKQMIVTEDMKKNVNDILNRRLNYSSVDTKLYYEKDVNIYKLDKNDGYKYHIAIFPNLIWDGDIEDRHIAFTGILDWLKSTLDFFKDRKDVRIYLKFHPAEVTIFKNSAKIQDLIQDYLKSNNIKNLILIPTESKIDPYNFLKSGIDLGIIYDGVLGIEMPFLKIPVILGAVRGRFNVEDGNFTVKNREEYFKLLNNFEDLIIDFHKNYEKYYENIVRYTFWYLFKNIFKIPTILKSDKYITNLFQVRPKDIKLDKLLIEIFS